MIIYTDAFSECELLTDSYKIQEKGLLWEVDCRKYPKGVDNIQLEGANPSAEEPQVEESDESPKEMVYEIQDKFNLTWLKEEEGLKPSKAIYKSHMKIYLKALHDRIATSKSEEEVNKWKKNAAACLKKITDNWNNYDVLVSSFDKTTDPMHVLIDYREDGVTPFATFWKDGLEEMKV